VVAGDIFLDVGTGTGALTRAFGTTCAPVVAIEPHPRNVAYLSERFDQLAVPVVVRRSRRNPEHPLPTRRKAMKQKSPTRLVLICGLPASGKTTLARQLASKIPAIRLDKDQWTTELGLDVWDAEFRTRLERQLWALTQELLAQGQSVILEWGHWARVERDEKRLGARALGVGVELRYLDAPLEELIERAQRRTASGEWSAAPMARAHFEGWASAFQPPDEEELLLFDEPVTEARFDRSGSRNDGTHPLLRPESLHGP
jgi:predicted kinase